MRLAEVFVSQHGAPGNCFNSLSVARTLDILGVQCAEGGSIPESHSTPKGASPSPPLLL